MIVMALDHLRDYLGNAHFDATDLSQTTPALFFARWIATWMNGNAPTPLGTVALIDR
jgi:hypothetical protein